MIHIFKLNDVEWWAAETLEQAIGAACQASGLPENEVVDEPYQLSVGELDSHTLFLLNIPLCSFAEGLQALVETHKDSIPCLFCGNRLVIQ